MAGTDSGVVSIREADDLGLYGMKAQSLAQLTVAGFPVPDGFCISADAYREHAERSGVAALVAILRGVPSSAPAVTLTPILQRIRSSVIHTPLDPSLVEAVRTRFDQMNPGGVSVRSSVTTAEMVSRPLAGRHGTYFVPGFHEALHAITHCWTSLWGDLCWRDREAAGLVDADVAVAVVVQHLVPASCSGVVFTADPATGDRDRIIVESCYGLGEAIVAGKVKPDRFTLTRRDLTVTASDVHAKPVHLVIDHSGRVVQRIVPADQAAAASVTPYEVREIAALALNVESLTNGPACVEWARASGTTWLLQARPLVVGS
jgi:phosphoenolpyruvate synthase/pyruvate phosphate dikinase